MGRGFPSSGIIIANRVLPGADIWKQDHAQTTWISTVANTTVTFEYFGKVDHIVIWARQGEKYYEGPPIPSFGSTGTIGFMPLTRTQGNVRFHCTPPS